MIAWSDEQRLSSMVNHLIEPIRHEFLDTVKRLERKLLSVPETDSRFFPNAAPSVLPPSSSRDMAHEWLERHLSLWFQQSARQAEE